ncbi:MAG: B12-binding domain-containing radical SAM protein [Proteobacteria bacterium]|nr:B12-binding domain-containing radical SAM protein [Pseudomonadota bacterium]MBU1386751.1 B12-binding domain-containing radical SAM protein [Pseudomonadota bacterium]MBU1544695.1 B12-binding domain-containing radical SAM protein [Pseudomonadota bacterium]MBU2431706.1 B12-binding domain-containing radical SAM protein [Pseudomonadota bacterium]MBU2480552.1 B12-binding domain-containing radical SAM protein [Pseudomonadota bacterium]
MKIALIASPYPLEECPSPPLGLTYIAAVCEAAGAQVIILDYIVRGYSKTKLNAELSAFGPDIVGTSCVTMNFKQAAQILQTAKQSNPEIITLMGGPHVSFDSENTLNLYPEIDIVVKGEAEATMAELLAVIQDRKKWSTVCGIAFKENGCAVTTGPRPLIQDLDALPLPARHLLPMSRYQALGYPVSIITSRGCPNQCIFCLGRKMVGSKVRYRSPKLIADEIETLVSSGSTFINIADDLFTSNKRRVKQLCDEIIQRNIAVSWSAFSRVNTIDAQTLKRMKKAGCHSVSFGIESGNPDMLRRVKKGITIDQAKKASKACKEAGIRGHASFMVGLPGETFETMTDSLNLQKELEIESAYHFLAPFPGTTIREKIQEYDLEILTDDWDLYNANQSIVRTAALLPEQMDAFVHASEENHRNSWDLLKKKYEEKTATPYEQMQVGGHYRMVMIFKLLTQDFIEQNADFISDPADALKQFFQKIASMAGLDHAFVESTMTDLINKGYIRIEESFGKTLFSWAH